MKTHHANRRGGRSLCTAISLGATLLVWGCSGHGLSSSPSGEQGAAEGANTGGGSHSGGEKSEAGGEEGGEEQVRHDADLLARLKARRCEHKPSVLDCGKCRHEVGAVELSAALDEAGKGELVRTARATVSTRPASLRLTGEVAFDEQRVVHVSPRVEGVARRVFVTTGDRIRAGAPLLEMDSVELGRIRARFLMARARVTLARGNYEREKTLFADKISSAREVLKSETAFREAEIELQSARDLLGLVGAATGGRTGAEARSGRLTVRTPMAGIVTSNHVAPGERIPGGKEIITVADLSVVWVWASVYERDLASLLASMGKGTLQASVQVAAFSGRRFPGVVDYVGATMDEATRTVKARVVLDNEDALLRPGMFATVSVESRGGAPALYLPSEAVVSDEGQRFVFVRIGKHRFLRRDVTTGIDRAGEVEITSGLGATEEVVVHGAFLLKSDILRLKMGAGCAD